jgi:hypothetical protein
LDEQRSSSTVWGSTATTSLNALVNVCVKRDSVDASVKRLEKMKQDVDERKKAARSAWDVAKSEQDSYEETQSKKNATAASPALSEDTAKKPDTPPSLSGLSPSGQTNPDSPSQTTPVDDMMQEMDVVFNFGDQSFTVHEFNSVLQRMQQDIPLKDYRMLLGSYKATLTGDDVRLACYHSFFTPLSKQKGCFILENSFRPN